jgi:hypothetical protein
VAEKAGHDTFVIHIDHVQYRVEAAQLSGAELRQLPSPPVTADRDLFLEEPGKEEDRIIQDGDKIQMKNGLQFYTGPGRINPG